MLSPERIADEVRERYAEAARAVTAGRPESSDALASNAQTASTCCDSSCCGATGEGDVFGAQLYDPTQTSDLPEAAVLASLGCGNPTAVAELHAGETVLDLGSGGGIDVFLSAKRVGPTGRAIGLDMTPDMLDLARQNARDAGIANVEFLEGRIEAVPLADASVDVVISNCVINLSADKTAVFSEIARVLRPGGRVGVSDVVARDDLSPEQRAERGSFVGCIAGALSFEEYERGLRAVGLTDVSVRPTHEVADGMFGAIVRATKPVS